MHQGLIVAALQTAPGEGTSRIVVVKDGREARALARDVSLLLGRLMMTERELYWLTFEAGGAEPSRLFAAPLDGSDSARELGRARNGLALSRGELVYVTDGRANLVARDLASGATRTIIAGVGPFFEERGFASTSAFVATGSRVWWSTPSFTDRPASIASVSNDGSGFRRELEATANEEIVLLGVDGERIVYASGTAILARVKERTSTLAPLPKPCRPRSGTITGDDVYLYCGAELYRARAGVVETLASGVNGFAVDAGRVYVTRSREIAAL